MVGQKELAFEGQGEEGQFIDSEDQGVRPSTEQRENAGRRLPDLIYPSEPPPLLLLSLHLQDLPAPPLEVLRAKVGGYYAGAALQHESAEH